uniref:Uncharacterized protein n=1 Tax=Dunaliella tertiolecta TaxID=3047 RepID=A0A7S3VT52_DUNTE
MNAAQQQQQQQEYGVAHARAHSPVVSVGTHAQGRRASVHSQPLPQLSPEYSTACGCASSPEVARDGHERFKCSSPVGARDGHERLALQGFFRPHAAATKCIQGLP